MNPRLTWSDLPAVLLAGVSAVTVTAGARLLRGQGELLMLALGCGVAGGTFMLDKLLVERLNAIRPRQSLVVLFLCWFPFFLLATALATLATFSWIAPEVARQDLEQGRRAHWTTESERVSQYILFLTSAVRGQVEAIQMEIDAERRRLSAARRDAAPVPPDALRALQRKLTMMRELERRLPTVQRLTRDLPSQAPEAQAQIDRVFRDLADVHATALFILPNPPALPTYQPLVLPSVDLQSVLAEDTKKRSWRAMTAWGTALWVELLPMLALWRGGRKIPLAARILQWRLRGGEILDAISGRRAGTPLPILIEPLQVRGIVRVALQSEYTLTDCSPLIEEAVRTLTDVLGSYQVSRISTVRGERVDEDVPLLPQLNGEPLVLSVIEDAP
jgi:hypothetical protein